MSEAQDERSERPARDGGFHRRIMIRAGHALMRQREGRDPLGGEAVVLRAEDDAVSDAHADAIARFMTVQGLAPRDVAELVASAMVRNRASG